MLKLVKLTVNTLNATSEVMDLVNFFNLIVFKLIILVTLVPEVSDTINVTCRKAFNFDSVDTGTFSTDFDFRPVNSSLLIFAIFSAIIIKFTTSYTFWEMQVRIWTRFCISIHTEFFTSSALIIEVFRFAFKINKDIIVTLFTHIIIIIITLILLSIIKFAFFAFIYATVSSFFSLFPDWANDASSWSFAVDAFKIGFIYEYFIGVAFMITSFFVIG